MKTEKQCIVFDAKDYKCICGKKGKYLNITFDSKYGNALCEKCRDKAIKEKVLEK